MKKALSLILAALMCAAMTPAVMAEEVAETPAVVEETVAPSIQNISITIYDKALVATPAHLVAVAAAHGITTTVEEVTALLGENELTPAAAVTALAALGITVTEEEVVAAVNAVAAPIEKYEITEMSAGFVVLVADVMGAAFPQESIDALLIAEAGGALTPSFLAGLFTRVGLEATEADIYNVAVYVLDYLQANYTVDSVSVDENGNPIAEEEIAAEEAAVEEIAEEAAVEEAAEEAVVEEVVEEEVSKYPVILEKLPTFGLFTKILSIFTFRG